MTRGADAGPGWPRPSAGSTCEHRHADPEHRGCTPTPRTASGPATGGATLWFTGLPSAGKSTIAHALADRLIADGVRVQVLDGDAVRPHLSAGLGFSRTDRDINVTRIGWVARLLAGHGVVVLVPVIAPYADARQQVRDDHAAAGVPFAEVFVSTSLAVAEERDVKGLYAKARARRDHRADRRRRPVRAPHHRRADHRHRRRATGAVRRAGLSAAGGSAEPDRGRDRMT